MLWQSANDENPGFTVYYHDDEQHPGHRYVIQKRNNDAGIWRLAFRANETDALRIIFVGDTLEECKEYAENFQGQLAV